MSLGSAPPEAGTTHSNVSRETGSQQRGMKTQATFHVKQDPPPETQQNNRQRFT